jgi:hypothetical protein
MLPSKTQPLVLLTMIIDGTTPPPSIVFPWHVTWSQSTNSNPRVAAVPVMRQTLPTTALSRISSDMKPNISVAHVIVLPTIVTSLG